jgi:hypothetical protein
LLLRTKDGVGLVISMWMLTREATLQLEDGVGGEGTYEAS